MCDNCTTDMEVELVIDNVVLDKIVSQDKVSEFLRFWISENKTKAVVVRIHWNEFIKKWETTLQEDGASEEEVIRPFLAGMKGIVTPYRNKYLCDDKIPEIELDSPIEETTRIINRHYATIKYVVVEDPKNYNQDDLKIDEEQLLDIEDFYRYNEVKNEAFVERFLSYYPE